VATQVGKACREVGFFYAQNDGVPDEVVQATFETIAKFFGQDHETKMETQIFKSPFLKVV
jgi:isopenicillin N synthase-like dioxygenase